MTYYFFSKIEVNGPLKDTYVLSNYACYNHNISIFKYEVGLNTILTQLVSNVLATYFYDTKVVQTLYPSTSYKLDVVTYVFIFLLQNILNLFFCVHIKKKSFLNWILGRLFFVSTLLCQHPMQ